MIVLKLMKSLITLKVKSVKIKNIITKEGEGYIHGKIVKKTNDDIFI